MGIVKRDSEEVLRGINNLISITSPSQRKTYYESYLRKILVNIAYYRFCGGRKTVEKLIEEARIVPPDVNRAKPELTRFNKIIKASIVYFKSCEIFFNNLNNTLTLEQFLSALNTKIRNMNIKFRYNKKDRDIIINDASFGLLEDYERKYLDKMQWDFEKITLKLIKVEGFDINIALFKELCFGYCLPDGYKEILELYKSGYVIYDWSTKY